MNEPQTNQPAHRLWLPAIPADGTFEIDADEANHAVRVKRLAPGEPVELFDGRGTIAPAIVAQTRAGKHPTLTVELTAPPRTIPPPAPAVEVLCPAPKADRAEWMIDQLSQVGAAAWQALRTARTQGDAAPRRTDRLDRVALEAAKQCGRPWLLRLDHTPIALEAALADAAARGVPAVLADASGTDLEADLRPAAAPRDAHGQTILLILGPEGGFTPAELALARDAGAAIHRFGPHIMRIETAAVVAAAILLASYAAPE